MTLVRPMYAGPLELNGGLRRAESGALTEGSLS
jgi:hypothetical protein